MGTMVMKYNQLGNGWDMGTRGCGCMGKDMLGNMEKVHCKKRHCWVRERGGE